MSDEVYEDPSNNQVAVGRIKCIFGEGSNSSINGNLNKYTDKGSGNVAFKGSSQEGVTTSSQNKRNSKINIPAAFLKNNCESSMYKPPVLPKKVGQTSSSSETKDEVHPKVPTKPKFPTDKESAVAAITRGLKLAEAKENGDISNINLRKKDTSESEEGFSQPPTSPKPINPFLLRDQKRKSQSGDEKSESTPPWKAKPESKPSTTDKPIPPWKLKNMQNQADGQKDNTPSWKTKTETSKTDVEKNDNLNSQETSKPLPPWKVKNLQNKSDSDKPEVTPPWKVKKEQTDGGSEEKPPSVVSKWKQQTQSSENTVIKPPFMKKNSGMGVDGNELSKVLGGLKKASVVQNFPKEEGPPVIRNLKTNRKSIKRKSLTRQIDKKKFYSIDIDTIEIETVRPPPKPPKLSPTINLDSIIKQYKALLDTSQDEDESEVLEQDEIYEELPEEEPVAIRRQSATNSSKKKLSRAVSLIPDMASDEEDEEYADTAVNTVPSLPPTDIPERPPVIPTRSRPPPPALPSSATEEPEQEEYQDVGNPEEEDLEQDELYEPLDEIQNEIDKLEEKKSNEDKKKEEREKKEREKEEKERKEREEKERKEREKEEQRKQKEEKKRQEEEKKRMEKDLKMWKKKFHVQQHELDQPQGEGDIKEDDKGGKNDLEVKKGMRVLLIRLTDNPKGKWLVKLATSGKVGYVESSNVEVDNTLIKSVMAGDYMNSENLPPPPPELLADDMAPEEEYADAEVGELVQDEVYEEV